MTGHPGTDAGGRAAYLPPSPMPRIGTDVVDVTRVRALVARHPNDLDRVFTSRELASCGGRGQEAERLAARFAAKEAALKALDAPHGQIMRLTEVEIVVDDTGRPRLCLHGKLAAWARRRGLVEAHVSMSHDGGVAVAQVLVTWAAPSTPRWFPQEEVAAALAFARRGGVALHRFRWDLRRFGLGRNAPACHVMSADLARLLVFGAGFGWQPSRVQEPPRYRPGIWHFDAFGGALDAVETRWSPDDDAGD